MNSEIRKPEPEFTFESGGCMALTNCQEKNLKS